MKEKRISSGFLWMAVLVAVVAGLKWQADACRIEPVIRPFPRPVQVEPIQTREHNVNIIIRKQTAEVTVQATFFNPNNADLEGDYWFPLYDDTILTSFSMIVDGREVKAELLDAKKARETYEQIVRQMRDPALLEFVGMRMLRQRIYPIKARSEVKVFLKYNQLLKNDSGLVSLKYPLSSAKPDKGRIGEVNISGYIESDTQIKNIYSSSHEINVNRESDKTAKIKFNAKDYYPDKPFVLYYTVSDDNIGVSLITHHTDEDGYFTLLVSPKIEQAKDKIIPKDIIFVIDTSGSMSGKKIESAQDALIACINNLSKSDRFNIIRFSDYIDSFKERLADVVPENVTEARSFVNRMSANGGTDINTALARALGQFDRGAGRLGVIVFLTDGLPSVGEQNIQNILKNAETANSSKARIFVFGVGNDVNTELLDKLSSQNSGACEYVSGEGSSIETSVGILSAKISSPVLSDVKLDFDSSVRIYDIYPRKLPDIFRGSQLVLCGRYSGDGKKTVTLSGRIGDERKEYKYEVDFKKESRDEFIQRLWAIKKVSFLLEEINLKGENSELVDEITKLSTKFGIVTPYTSFLITDDTIRRTSLGNMPKEEAMTRFKDDKTGGFAVQRSQILGKSAEKKVSGQDYILPAAASMSQAESVEFERQLKQAIVSSGEKTFIVDRDGYYIDTEYKPEKDKNIIQIKFLSDEYFTLMKDNPDICRYLSVNSKVILKYKGRVYRITD